MLQLLPEKISIEPIIEQVQSLGNFGKRLVLNDMNGEFFSDPWTTKIEFNDTPLGNLLSQLGPIGQARLLCLESGESYTAHADPDDRIHLAVTTNPYSFLVDISGNHLHHIPADGSLWRMDTSKTHVAANWGPRSRVHLNIRCLLPKFKLDRSGIRIAVSGGDYDWKQETYIELMGFINQQIKNNYITGFSSTNERELFVNCDLPEMFLPMIDKIKSKNIAVEFTKLMF
jgi:hypothetical protein